MTPAERRAPGRRRAIVVAAPTDTTGRWRAILEPAGLDVSGVGEAALLADPDLRRPSLVLLDDRRGRAERLDVLARLRTHPVLHTVPFLVVSEDCAIDSFGGAIARGAAAFLREPVDPAELREVAARLVEWREDRPRGGRARRAARRPLLLGVDVDVPGRGLVRGRMVDASATGCRLELAQAVDESATVGIIPRSCEDSTDIRLAGVVQWSRPAREGVWVAVRWTGSAAMLARRILGLAQAGARARRHVI